MEFDFEEDINGVPQQESAQPEHFLLQQQADSRGQGYDEVGVEPSAGPMDPGRQVDQHQQEEQAQHQHQQRQQHDQQPQQTQQLQQQLQFLGPSIQSLREARDAGGQVYIANLTWWTTDMDVESVCSTFGPVSGLQFVEDRTTGRSKGVVLVEFADVEAAARCKEQLSGKPVNGRPCVVTFAGSGGSGGKAGSSHRTGGPTPGPAGGSFPAGPGMGGEGRPSGGRGGHGGRGGRGGGRGGRGMGDRGDRAGMGGGGFGVPAPGQIPQDMTAQLGMPPLGPGVGRMGGMGPHGNNFLGAMAAAGNPLALLPGLLSGGVGPMAGVGPMGGVPGPMGGVPGPMAHHGMGGPGHFMSDRPM